MARQKQLAANALFALLLLSILTATSVTAGNARDAVSCNTSEWNGGAQVFTLSDGECFDLDLGDVSPETILEFDISISGDAIDVLFFDDNGAQTYLLGQNYHLTLVSEPTFEEQSDPIYFHWSTPSSLDAKGWHLILDNSGHDGDEGLGDQGGNDSSISINISTIERDYYEVYHDTNLLAPSSHLQIAGGAELTLDAGSTIDIQAWSVEGDVDVYLMTENQRTNYLAGVAGDTHIAAASLTSITSEKSVSWTVPEMYDGVTFHLMLDNQNEPSGGGDGSSSARTTISAIVNPVLAPVIGDNLVFAVAELGDGISFNATETPNRQNQIETLEWDLDTGVDSDNDGDFTNDIDSTGWIVQSTYTTPGVHTVSLKVTSPRGDVAYSSHQVTITDSEPPEIQMTHNGVTDSDGHAQIDHDKTITFTVSATDGHVVASTRWLVDGELLSETSTLQKSWSQPGMHEIIVSVSDASGNAATENFTVEVVDGTIPQIERSACEVPVTATAGESIILIAAASDAWDDDSTLRYHWDLDPLFDSNSDGDMRNDPDLSGESTGHVFSNSGEHSIVLNVRDSAGNSDKMVFTIQVADAPDSGGFFGFTVVIIFIFLVTAIVAAIGYIRIQENAGMQMLIENGLTTEEAKQRMMSVKSTNKIALFAAAAERIGSVASEVKTPAQLEFEQQQVVSQQLYGSQDPNAGFAPRGGRSGAEAELAALAGLAPTQQQSASGGGRQLSDDEMALMAGLGVAQPEVQSQLGQQDTTMLAESSNPDIEFLRSLQDQTDPTVDVKSGRSGAVSGGVEIPQMSPPAQTDDDSSNQAPTEPAETGSSNEQVKAECAGCGKAMAFSFPPNVEEVLIDCPSCGKEQIVAR